ncbi:Transmembrane exosortase (Exosortase_EpsH) [Rubripirellula lacrimiformis]|uniref:Transmembrane exosortase (Exosortase_EpsH) n=1 Tax=Rubripirellula lacrimiformis TaxID=1930273 RepID=A0A517N911_9BACT|nr:exosortase U [Rubripirellula lacrimiformis]QDT03488.1 Transmembrane exosortase (Exosortase_EpsH) [Rubripirellula lacrimiformis]
MSVSTNPSDTSYELSRGFQLDPRDHAAALFWGLLLLGSLPFLAKYCVAMWNQDLYQYFPFLLAAVGGLAYLRFDHRIRLPQNLWSRLPLALALAFLIAAAILSSSWLGAISFILLTTSFLAAQRAPDGRSLAYLAIPMVMFIRAPQLGTYTIMARLQRTTTDMSSILLDVFGVLHVQRGNTIELTSKFLFVAEACSGVQSLFTICFLAFLVLVYQRRRVWLTPLYLLLAFFFAIVGNVVRVTAIALGEDWFGIDLSTGIRHELVGYFALAIAAGMLVSFDHLIGLIPWATAKSVADGTHTGTVRERAAASTGVDSLDWAKSLRSLGMVRQGTIGVAILCGVAMLTSYWMTTPDVRPVVATDQVLYEPSPAFLSDANLPISVVAHQASRDPHGDRNARHGMNSDVWQCGIDGNPGQFVLSQPYMGWHELTFCYKAQNWKMQSRRTVVVPGIADPIVVADFAATDGTFGCLVFTGVDSNGEIPRTPGHSPYSRAMAPFYPLILDDFAETSGTAQTLMLQYWMTDAQPITPEAKQAVVDTMTKIRQYTQTKLRQDYQATLGETGTSSPPPSP